MKLRNIALPMLTLLLAYTTEVFSIDKSIHPIFFKDHEDQIYVENKEFDNEYTDVVQVDRNLDSTKYTFIISKVGDLPDVFHYNSNTYTLTNISSQDGHNICPNISPDGSKVVFQRYTNEGIDLMLYDDKSENLTRLDSFMAWPSREFKANPEFLDNTTIEYRAINEEEQEVSKTYQLKK